MRARHRFEPLWLAVLLLPALAAPLAAEPFVPERDEVVVETLPATDPVLGDALGRLSARLAEEPDHLPTAIRLAAAYTELGRRRGDPRYDGYAEAALAPWWNQASPPVPVLLLRATLAQRRHFFEAALADLDRVLARQPRHPQAWLSKATIQAVRGETDAAFDACAALNGRVDRVIEAACVAAVARNTEDAPAAYDRLAALVRENPASDPRITVWTQALQGELALQLDHPAKAEEHFLAALGADPADPYVLGAYADLLLDQDRAAEVRALLEDYAAVDPLLLRLALAEDRIDPDARDRHILMLADRFATARRRGDVVHRREEARFTLALLRQPQRALELALANAAVQREPADLRLVLETALAAGQPEAAAAALERIARSGLIDPRIQALQARFAAAS